MNIMTRTTDESIRLAKGLSPVFDRNPYKLRPCVFIKISEYAEQCTELIELIGSNANEYTFPHQAP